MATVLEISKLVTAAYLHLQWKHVDILSRTYLTLAVIVLMVITSMGIFGFLSKAHLDQTIQADGNNELRIEMLERKIQRQQRLIADSEKVLAQLDGAVETLQKYDRIRGPNGSLAVRSEQAEERDSLNNTIAVAYSTIEGLQEELLPLRKEQLSLEAEIGPLKYIAQIIYGENYDVDTTVRLVIILFVCVFDPLAVMLLIVSTAHYKRDLNKTSVVKTKEIMIME